MKKLITLFVLFLGLGIANAQTPTFDETVKYINNIFKEIDVDYFYGDSETGFYITEVKVVKNGKVSFIDSENNVINSFNLFDFDKFNGDWAYVDLLDKNNRPIGWWFGISISEPQFSKLEKAFKHLRTLCVKEHDPFE